jgi:hypothetical protein
MERYGLKIIKGVEVQHFHLVCPYVVNFPSIVNAKACHALIDMDLIANCMAC